jgi:hypothetical protein
LPPPTGKTEFPPLAKANVPQDSEIPLFSRCEREKRVLNISQFITFLSDTNTARIYIFIFSVAILYLEILKAFVALGPLLVLGFPTPFGGPDYKLLL